MGEQNIYLIFILFNFGVDFMFILGLSIKSSLLVFYIPIIGPSPLELGFLMLRLSSLYKQNLYSFSRNWMINENLMI